MTRSLQFFSFIAAVCAAVSCSSSKKVPYLQDAGSFSPQRIAGAYQVKIGNDDLLSIAVSSKDTVLAQPFNRVPGGQGYLVNASGGIYFPIFGEIHAVGRTPANGGRFIEQAILSVLHQERQADEILVCDDNSTDDTLAICRRYEGRVRIFQNEEGPSGFVNSWNKAIARAKGDFISILHQDDVLMPAFIRVGLGALEQAPGVRHLFCTCRYMDEQGQALFLSMEECSGKILRLTGPEYLRAYQRQGHPHIHRCPGVITHRSIFDVCRYEPAAGHIADDDFFYRVGEFTNVIGIFSPLASFRLHVGSVTGRMKDTELVRSLMEDYIYQCRQWKGSGYLDKAGYAFFVRHARKYIRRYIGYGIRLRRPGFVVRGMREWGRLWGILHLRGR